VKRWLPSIVVLLTALAVSWDGVIDTVDGVTADPTRMLVVAAWGLVATMGGVVPVSWLLEVAGCRSGNDATPNRWMGAIERAAIYALVLLEAPKAIGGLLLLKTAIRWPRLEEATKDDHFAEAFFLSMFFNLALGVTCAVAAGADLSSLP